MLYVGRAVLARIVSAVGQQVKSIRFRGGGGAGAARRRRAAAFALT